MTWKAELQADKYSLYILHRNYASEESRVEISVNAIGIPLKTLYKGTWDAGEHSVTIDMKMLQPSSYIVLRKGTEILSWNLLN